MKYFFHIREDGSLVPDDEGTECSSFRAAQAEAFRTICDLASATLFVDCTLATVVEIADCDGNVLESVSVPRTMH
jgi:hypothetical protein